MDVRKSFICNQWLRAQRPLGTFYGRWDADTTFNFSIKENLLGTGLVFLGKLEVPPLKIVIVLWSLTVKENHIGSVVIENFLYTHIERQAFVGMTYEKATFIDLK